MLMPLLAILGGLIVLLLSADRFVAGAAATARHAGLPPLLIGMVVVGFGTSAPELMVSGLAAASGSPGIALGNAYGSNIANIGLILGVVALIQPLSVHTRVLRWELPVLIAVSLLSGWQLWDGNLSRGEATVLLLVFAVLLGWSIHQGLSQRRDILGAEFNEELIEKQMPLARALVLLAAGLIFLLLSSRLLVWGSVLVARDLGVDEMVIGLTVVALGTSLPELASSIMAVRRNEHDIAVGNVVGSNLFNTLAVVGLAGVIDPIAVNALAVLRDWGVMTALVLALAIMGHGFWGPGRIGRIEGGLLLLVYLGYMGWLATHLVRVHG